MGLRVARSVDWHTMNRPGLISVVSVFAFLLLSPASLAQSHLETQQKISEKPPSGPHEGPAIEESYPPGQILIEGHSVATVYEPVAGLSPEERAENIKERILAIARSNASPDAIVLQSRNAWTEILLDNQIIMAVTEADAAATGKPREQIAFEDAERIRQSIRTYRKEHGWTLILRGFLKAIIASLVLCL